jgi:hypothetical protein
MAMTSSSSISCRRSCSVRWLGMSTRCRCADPMSPGDGAGGSTAVPAAARTEPEGQQAANGRLLLCRRRCAGAADPGREQRADATLRAGVGRLSGSPSNPGRQQPADASLCLRGGRAGAASPERQQAARARSHGLRRIVAGDRVGAGCGRNRRGPGRCRVVFLRHRQGRAADRPLVAYEPQRVQHRSHGGLAGDRSPIALEQRVGVLDRGRDVAHRGRRRPGSDRSSP